MQLGTILPDLTSVVAGSETGRKMFSRALNEAQFGLVEAKLAAVLSELKGKDLTKQVLDDNKALFTSEVASIGKSVSETFRMKEKPSRAKVWLADLPSGLFDCTELQTISTDAVRYHAGR